MSKHAAVLSHDHPQRDTFPQQQAFFNERILPRIQAMPGFSSGEWGYDAVTSRTHSYVVFETEAQARALIELVRSEDTQPNPFSVKLLSATLVERTTSRP